MEASILGRGFLFLGEWFIRMKQELQAYDLIYNLIVNT